MTQVAILWHMHQPFYEGPRHPRAHPAVGAPPRAQGLLRDGGAPEGVSRRAGDLQPGAVAPGAAGGVRRESRAGSVPICRQFYGLFADGHLQIGPGVFDVHSPHSPGTSTMDERLEHFLGFMSATDLWVNPDCGLKTRGWNEIERQLGDMVAAARHRREAAEA